MFWFLIVVVHRGIDDAGCGGLITEINKRINLRFGFALVVKYQRHGVCILMIYHVSIMIFGLCIFMVSPNCVEATYYRGLLSRFGGLSNNSLGHGKKNGVNFLWICNKFTSAATNSKYKQKSTNSILSQFIIISL